jgi:hypothetical protein
LGKVLDRPLMPMSTRDRKRGGGEGEGKERRKGGREIE